MDNLKKMGLLKWERDIDMAVWFTHLLGYVFIFKMNGVTE
jgi:hypothetical protein